MEIQNKKHLCSIKVIAIIITVLLLCFLNIAMFAFLRPQDRYLSTIGTVTESINNSTIYENDKGRVQYYADHIKYEYRFGSFMFNAHKDGDKYLIRYSEDDPTKVRSYLFPFFMMLNIFGEFILIVILYFLISSILLLHINSRNKPWKEENWKRAKKINNGIALKNKMSFGFIASLSAMLIVLIFLSQPLYNSINNYIGSTYNYSKESAQELECGNDNQISYIEKENKELYYSVKPIISQKYVINIMPKLEGYCEIMTKNNEIVFQKSFNNGESLAFGLLGDNVYYIRISYNHQLEQQLAIILTIKGENNHEQFVGTR